MTTTITLKELRPSLPQVISRIDGRMDRYVVTKRGKPVAVMLSAADYDSLVETMEILADKEAMKGIRKGLEDIRKGRTISLEDLKKRLAKI